MTSPSDIRSFFGECRLLAEQGRDLRLKFAAMREAATAKGIDWSQLKALATADVADEEKGDGKKVAKVVEKADFASAYADILGLRRNEDERKTETRSSSRATEPQKQTPVSVLPEATKQRPATGEPVCAYSARPIPHPQTEQIKTDSLIGDGTGSPVAVDLDEIPEFLRREAAKVLQ